MANAHNQTKSKGAVRIRSNVCTDPGARHLIPGDVLRRYGYHGNVTDRQHTEKMYYEPCVICRRTIFQILEDGCDHPICRTQEGMLSTAEAADRKQRFHESTEFV